VGPLCPIPQICRPSTALCPILIFVEYRAHCETNVYFTTAAAANLFIVQCSTTCGEGVQLRNVSCPHEGLCDDERKPPDRRLCDAGPCLQWVADSWSQVRCHIPTLILCSAPLHHFLPINVGFWLFFDRKPIGSSAFDNFRTADYDNTLSIHSH